MMTIVFHFFLSFIVHYIKIHAQTLCSLSVLSDQFSDQQLFYMFVTYGDNFEFLVLLLLYINTTLEFRYTFRFFFFSFDYPYIFPIFLQTTIILFKCNLLYASNLILFGLASKSLITFLGWFNRQVLYLIMDYIFLLCYRNFSRL